MSAAVAGTDAGSSAASPFVLAACAEMLFLDLPFEERVRRIDEAGFEVEIWRWWEKDLESLVATGATFGSMSGYIRGELIDPDGPTRSSPPRASRLRRRRC